MEGDFSSLVIYGNLEWIDDGVFFGFQKQRDGCSLVCVALQKWAHKAALTD